MTPSDSDLAAQPRQDDMLSDDAIVEHLVGRLRTATPQVDPFEFVVVSDALPASFYRQIEAVYPTPEDEIDLGLKTIKDRRKSQKDGYSDRRMSLNPSSLDPEVLANLPDPVQQLFRVMTDKRFSTAMIRPFGETAKKMTRAHLKREGHDPTAHRVTLSHNVEMVYDRTGFNLAPHTDSQHKLATALLYFPQSGDPEDMGTHIYQAKNPDALTPDHLTGKKGLSPAESEHRGYVTYRPNTMLVFARTDRSFHGVPPTASRRARRVVQSAINFTHTVTRVR